MKPTMAKLVAKLTAVREANDSARVGKLGVRVAKRASGYVRGSHLVHPPARRGVVHLHGQQVRDVPQQPRHHRGKVKDARGTIA